MTFSGWQKKLLLKWWDEDWIEKLIKVLLWEWWNDEISEKIKQLLEWWTSVNKIQDMIKESCKSDEEKIFELFDIIFSDKEKQLENLSNFIFKIIIEWIHSLKIDQLEQAYFSWKDQIFKLYYRKSSNEEITIEEITLRTNHFYSDLLVLKNKFDEYNKKYGSCSFIQKRKY